MSELTLCSPPSLASGTPARVPGPGRPVGPHLPLLLALNLSLGLLPACSDTALPALTDSSASRRDGRGGPSDGPLDRRWSSAEGGASEGLKDRSPSAEPGLGADHSPPDSTPPDSTPPDSTPLDTQAPPDSTPPDSTPPDTQARPDIEACGTCPAGLDCVGGSCRCVEGGSCAGCCASDSVCIEVPSVAQCGNGGSACRACTPNKASHCLGNAIGGFCSCHDGFGPPRGECQGAQVCTPNGSYFICRDPV